MRKKIVAFLCIVLFIMAALRPPVVYADTEGYANEEGADDEKPSKSPKSSSSSSKKKQEAENNKKRNEINQKIRENESQMSDAESEKDKLKSGMDAVRSSIYGLENEKNSLESVVSELDSNLDEIQSEINELDEQIADTESEIEQLNKKITAKELEIKAAQDDLEAATQTLEEKYEDTKDHIRYMYTTRNGTFLEIILAAGGVEDLLNRAEYISKLAEYDKEQINEYKAATEAVKEKKIKLNEENVALNELKASAENKQNEIKAAQDKASQKSEEVNRLISEKEKEIGAYEASISSKEAQIKEYLDMIAAQDALIKSLEAAITEQRNRLMSLSENSAEGNGLRKYDGGKFAFPAPSYTRISDDYGNRIHPTLGIEQFHNGIDLAAPSGSSIVSAYDGTIIAADYSATMGNYIIIDHGDSLMTIYMHASSLYVSKGDSVSKGQKIAAVGSTGRSTGPHLHFSVRSGGKYVSPWNYLK